MLRHWNPVVAYEAGQCGAYDTLEIRSDSLSARFYPNPFRNSCQLEVDSEEDDDVKIEICDQLGNRVMEGIECPITSGEKKTITMDCSLLRENLYIYKIRSRNKTTYGKLFKIN